jgi:hypothetical protein
MRKDPLELRSFFFLHPVAAQFRRHLRTGLAHAIVILTDYPTSLKNVKKLHHCWNVGHKMETRL